MSEAQLESGSVLEAAVRNAAERGNGLAAVQYRGLAKDWRIRFESDSAAVTLANTAGTFSADAKGGETAEVTLTASEADWAQFLAATPAPGYQTLHAMVMKGLLTLSGDTLLYQQYLLALEMMFDRLPKADTTAAPDAPPALEPVVGRYVNLSIDGQPQRVYFEEAGAGTPLVCLHTAGADGRQYRGLLNDSAVTDRFRVIVFDLPRHGKSSLASGYLGDPYLLTTERYVNFVMTMIDALELDNPIVMGCSIGGRAVLHLALLHGDRFRAAIGLQSALHADAGGDDMTGQSASYLFRPDTNGPEIGAAVVAGITAPNAPPADRWETLWYYMQGGPGVFLGDLYYYFEDGDLRNRINRREVFDDCPLYLLTGEYDLSATPEMTAEVAELTGARHFEVMRGLGHFPMSEDYGTFREYLLPVLEKIEKS